MQKKRATKPNVTKASLAYNRIRKMIIARQISSENRISLRILAGKLSMSVVPVSEAVRKLEQEGFLETKPQSGIRIPPLSPRRKRDISIFRLALEVQAARMVTQKANPRDLESIKKLVCKIQNLLRENKQQEAAYVDFTLHRKIVSSAGCAVLTEKYNQIAILFMIGPGQWDDDQWPRKEAAGKDGSHKDILDSLLSKNPDKAEKAIRRHINL